MQSSEPKLKSFRDARRLARISANLESAVVLNAYEVAALLGCHTATVWRKTHAGELPKPVKIVGRTVWKRAEIEALIDEAE